MPTAERISRPTCAPGRRRDRRGLLVIAGSGLEQRALARGQVDVDEARDRLSQLEQALGQADPLPAFEAAVDAMRG